LIVDVESPQSISEAVNLLVKDESLQRAMQERAIIARRQYNWEQEKGRLLAVYDSIFMESRTK